MQSKRGLVFLALALAMGGAAAWYSGELVSSGSPAGNEIRTVSLVVVRDDVPVATSLKNEQLRTVQWPADHVPAGALSSIDGAVGRIVRRPLAAGEPVLQTALFDVGAAGGLPAVISEGQRAVSVKVDNVIGVAGFVTPGARVDVLATMRRVDWKKALPYSKVILQNIRVLAVDKMLEQVSSDPEDASVVTLEVEPKQAERLIYAAHEGRLQLAMRSPGDDDEVKTRSVNVKDVFAERRVARSRPGTRVQLINGAKLSTKKF